MLCDTLDYNELDKETRLEVNSAIAYFVIPNDVIPEEVYGPYGYIDDIFISAYVLKKIAQNYGYDFLEELWNGDTNLKNVINECYEQSLILLEDNVYSILSFSGIIAKLPI